MSDDLSGRTFGRLTVLQRVANDPQGYRMFACICVCGKAATVKASNLLRRHKQSCGCLTRSRPKYPWADTAVGGGFFVPHACSSGRPPKPGEIRLSTHYGKTLVPGSQWTTRRVVKGGVAGLRVERVA